MERMIYVVIGCDTDPDRDYFVRGIPPDTLGWRGMTEGIPRAKERMAKITDSDGQPPRFTWLLRADHQIAHMHGSMDWVLTQHADLLRSLEEDGDELGWHPHFWIHDEAGGHWYQNYADVDWQVRMLEEAYRAYQVALPGRARTVRMGWTYHNNRTFRTLERLGVQVELSAIPGLRIRPSVNRSRLSNFYDWSVTPSRPYYPSAVDYRRPARGDEEQVAVLEAPNTVARSFVWGMISGMALAKKMMDLRPIAQALVRPRFMSTITGKPALFAPMLSQIRRDLDRDDAAWYITPLHPDELIDNIHPVYSLENMEANLRSILRLAEARGAKVRYLTACEIRKHFPQPTPKEE